MECTASVEIRVMPNIHLSPQTQMRRDRSMLALFTMIIIKPVTFSGMDGTFNLLVQLEN